LFCACSEEIKDLSLVEALQRLLVFVLNKIGKSREFAESVVITMADTIMSAAIEFFQSKRRFVDYSYAYLIC